MPRTVSFGIVHVVGLLFQRTSIGLLLLGLFDTELTVFVETLYVNDNDTN